MTEPDMTRYLMPLRTAAELCLTAIDRMEGGETFILKMPRVRVGDLVEVLVEAYAGRFGYRADEIEIEHIGARAGEKLHEALMTDAESRRAIELGDMWVVPRAGVEPSRVAAPEPPELLDRTAIRDLLDSAGWLTPEAIPTLS